MMLSTKKNRLFITYFFIINLMTIVAVAHGDKALRLTKDAVEISAEIYPLNTASQTAQFKHLLTELRCLVCQNQDLSDSNAPLAKDLRQQVYDMVKNNQSDYEITQYLIDRYGDFILFKPPIKPLTYLLWLGPLLFIFVGIIIFIRTCTRNNNDA